MIETIKDKLRDRNLDLSPAVSDDSYGKRLINGSSDRQISPASSQKVFEKAKEPVKRDPDELSNGSKGSPASCNEAADLSQVSNDIIQST